jgi:hypothetical protein
MFLFQISETARGLLGGDSAQDQTCAVATVHV